MRDFLKMHKLLIIAALVCLAVAVIAIPLLINLLFKLPAPHSVFEAEWQASSALSYYGSVLSFLGTGMLSVLALWQNHKIQTENDKHTNLLEQMEREKYASYFAIGKCIVIGNGSHITIPIQNISANLAQDLSFSDFRFVYKDEHPYWISEDSFSENYLGPSMECKLELDTLGIKEVKTTVEFLIKYKDIFGLEHKRKAIGYFKNDVSDLRFITCDTEKKSLT